MTLSIFLQFVVVLAAIWMGARSSGVGLGLWGAVGLDSWSGCDLGGGRDRPCSREGDVLSVAPAIAGRFLSAELKTRRAPQRAATLAWLGEGG